jgi:hypothetical protein
MLAPRTRARAQAAPMPRPCACLYWDSTRCSCSRPCRAHTGSMPRLRSSQALLGCFWSCPSRVGRPRPGHSRVPFVRARACQGRAQAVSCVLSRAFGGTIGHVGLTNCWGLTISPTCSLDALVKFPCLVGLYLFFELPQICFLLPRSFTIG